MAFVRGMLSGVQARGQPCEEFLTAAGIDPKLLAEANAQVTGEQYVALFQVLTERLNDEGFGMFSRPMKRGSYTLMVSSAFGATTLEVAMRRFARIFWMLQDDLVLEPVRDGALAGWALRFSDSSKVWPNFMHEMLLRFYWRALAWLVGDDLPISHFDLAFDCPPYAGSYGEILPATLKFGQPYSAFWFEAARLRDPVRKNEDALRVFLANVQYNMILPRHSYDATGVRVRLYLQKSYPAWPDLASTARALNMSIATLRRNLANEGTAFQALKDELRLNMAISRLNNTKAPLAQLADELGFADSVAFQRAFKRWTGSAAGAYRRQKL